MSYPSSILSITNPLSSNTLNSPDHAQQHTLVNNDLIAVESVLGVQNSLDPNSITYQVQNPASQGGGHIQGASYGGTGQTYYNKGDILVGVSASVVGRQAAGPQGYAVTYDSTQTNGLNSAPILTAPVIQNQIYTYAQGSILSASVYGAQITPTPSLLQGTSFDIKWPQTNTSSVLALSISGLVSVLVKNPDGTNPAIGAIKASVIGTVKFDAVSSIFRYSDTADAENLVGTLPVLNGANLTGISVGTVQVNQIATVAITAGQAVTATYYQSDTGITFDAHAFTHLSNTATVTASFTVGNNSNRILVVGVVTNGTISVLTYNGISLLSNAITSQALNASYTLYTYYLFAPSTGANNLVFTTTGNCYAEVSINSYYNASQTSQPDADSKTATSNAGAATAITTSANGAMVVVMGGTGTGVSGSWGTFNNAPNNLVSENNAEGFFIASANSNIVYPGSQTFTITHNPSLSGSWTDGIINISLAPATTPSSGGVTPSSSSTIGYGQNLYSAFEGFAGASASALGTVPIIVAGTVQGLTLTPNTQYYLNDSPGTIGSVIGSNSRKVGIAISSSVLLITNNW